MKAFLASLVVMAVIAVGADFVLNNVIGQTAGEQASASSVRLD